MASPQGWCSVTGMAPMLAVFPEKLQAQLPEKLLMKLLADGTAAAIHPQPAGRDVLHNTC